VRGILLKPVGTSGSLTAIAMAPGMSEVKEGSSSKFTGGPSSSSTTTSISALQKIDRGTKRIRGCSGEIIAMR
jgi:hypothetical protein